MKKLSCGFISTWLEKIFPERNDYRLVRLADEGDILRLLSPIDHGDFISLLPFNEPLVRAAIHEAKFQKNEKAWTLLAAALTAYLKHHQADTLLIPIPLGNKRQRKRGYNQVAEVAKIAVQSIKHIKIKERLLYRTRDTVPQTNLNRQDRLQNMVDAFRTRDPHFALNRNIILLDDVATTGATLKAAKTPFKDTKPASITLLAISH